MAVQLTPETWNTSLTITTLCSQIPFCNQFLSILLLKALSGPSTSFHLCCHFPSLDCFLASFCSDILTDFSSSRLGTFKFILYPEAGVLWKMQKLLKPGSDILALLLSSPVIPNHSDFLSAPSIFRTLSSLGFLTLGVITRDWISLLQIQLGKWELSLRLVCHLPSGRSTTCLCLGASNSFASSNENLSAGESQEADSLTWISSIWPQSSAFKYRIWLGFRMKAAHTCLQKQLKL